MPTCLPKWLNYFAFPSAKSNTCLSTSLSAIGIVSVLDLTMLIGVWRHLIVVWIFICLIIHHFKCLFAICKYSLMRSMLRTFAKFLIKLFFLLLSFKNFFAFLDNFFITCAFWKYFLLYLVFSVSEILFREQTG